jgi:UDP-N-acetylglucosamine:LPS N-acetylglucosamine transferase
MSKNQSFTDFKAYFYGKITDFSLFDCADFNVLKIVLDGLRVDYISRGPVKSPIFGSIIKYEFENMLRRINAKLKRTQKYSSTQIAAFKNKAYLISDDGRVALDSTGMPHSYYFTNLMQSLNENDFLHIIDKKRNEKATCDLNYEHLINTFLLLPLNKKEKTLIKDIRITYNKIKISGLFNEKELQNIAFAFQNFFNKYKIWSRLLDEINPHTMFTIVHYHNEGKILAFKRKGIKVIELQHGLISTTDVFYVFPAQTKSIIHKALFADQIWVYGNYWKNVLEKGVEYLNKIKVAGYYLYDNFSGYEAAEKEIDAFAEGKKLIIVTTQTTLHKAFIDYILWLVNDIASRNLPYKILVKTHPLEKQEHYAILHETAGVKMVNHPLPVLFKKTQLHVTIYSTTLYDGARVGVPGFALYNEQYKDYINEIVQSGVAYPLAQHENPIDLIDKLKVVDSSYYYSDFQIEGL